MNSKLFQSILPWQLILGSLAAVFAGESVTDTDAASDSVALPQRFTFAVSALEMLRADPEQESRYRLKVAEALGRRGLFDAAEEVAGKCTDHHGGMGFARLAAISAQKGNAERADGFLKQARAEESKMVGRHAEWISAEIGVVLAELGRFDEAQDAMKAAGNSIETGACAQRVAVIYARELLLHRRPEKFPGELGQMQFGEREMKAAGYSALAAELLRSGAKDQAAKALNEAWQAAEEAKGWPTLGDVRRTIQTSWENADQERALQLLAAGAKRAGQIPEKVEFKAAEMAAMARLALLCKQRDAAAALLADGERSARALFDADRPTGCALIAAAYEEAGETAKARELWLFAIQQADHHPNRRVRGFSVVEFCLAQEAIGSEFAPELAAGIAAILQRN